MPYSKSSILVIEDDSRVSRVLRDHLEKAFPKIRVEIAGSPAKAKATCTQFPPSLIIWDGAPNERGTTEDYTNAIPASFWSRVVSISIQPELQEIAKDKGAKLAFPKHPEALNSWCDQLAVQIKPLLPKPKKR